MHENLIELQSRYPGAIPNTMAVQIDTGPKEERTNAVMTWPQRWTVTAVLAPQLRGRYLHRVKGKALRRHAIRPPQPQEYVAYEGNGPPHVDDLHLDRWKGKEDTHFFVQFDIPPPPGFTQFGMNIDIECDPSKTK